MPNEIALQHFDNFYAKVYANSWKSYRIGLLTPNKYCAVINKFANSEETESEMRLLGAIELGNVVARHGRIVNLACHAGPYYEKHWKKYQRMLMRRRILKEKREKKIAYLKAAAAAEGLGDIEINESDVEVSDVSDGELRRMGLGSSGSSGMENALEMFQTEIENNMGKPANQAGLNVNLNDFVPATELKYDEEIVDDTEYYSFYQSDVDVPVKFSEENKLEFPDILKVFTFPRGSLLDFPQPKTDKALDVLNYYLMDGASILPVIALNIQPKDIVGDFCAAPGGKALAALLTLRPQLLVLNDKSQARVTRLKAVLDGYVPRLKMLKELVQIRNEAAEQIKMYNTFDKILLDVPCTTDRTAVNSNENNLFKTSRIKERLAMPHEQQAILVNGIKCLKAGGSLIYSTCSMSPIQNDGVVHMALKQIYESTQIECTVVDLKEALRPLRGLYQIHRGFKYGQQIVPFLPKNYGPMYICKIVRNT